MSNLHHFHERVDEVFFIDESDKNFEKNNNSISSNSSNVILKYNSQHISKSSKFDSMISKIYPKLSFNNFNKIGNSNAHEDLTEVTATDIITEPSDLHKSNELMNEILKVFPQNLGISSKNHLINHNNFIMLNTEESPFNFDVFSGHNIIPDKSYINQIKFPFLQVESNNFLIENFKINKKSVNFHRISTSKKTSKIENNFSHFDFFVSPENIIKTKLEIKSITSNHKQSKTENNTNIPIINYDRVLNLEKSDENMLLKLNEKKSLFSENINVISTSKKASKIENNFSNFDFFVSPENIIKTKLEIKSFTSNHKQSKAENNTNIPIIKYDRVLNLEKSDENMLLKLNEKKSLCSENINANLTEDSTLNILSNSDIGLYNGYTKTADSTEYLDRNIMREKLPQTVDKTPSYKTDIFKQIDKNLAKEKNFNQITDYDNISNIEYNDYGLINQAKRDHDGENKKLTADLRIIPILPPDMLGQVHFQTGNNAKHFLAIKSIDENGWNELLDINMSDKNDVYSSENISNFYNDESLLNIHKTANFHQTLNKTFGNMDKKISEIQKNPSDLKEESTINTMSYLNSNKNHCFENKSDKSINDRFENSKVLAVKYEETSSSKSDVLLFSDPSLSLSGTDVSNISSRSLSKMQFMPKLNLDNIGTNKTENTEFSNHNEKTLDKISIKPRSLINKTRSRNYIDKSNYFRRKYDGKQLALKVLNQIGLPLSSSEIPIKTINSVTSNEMMLYALKNSQHQTLLKSSYLQSESILKCYKKTLQSPYFEKVRLQRPEITRREISRPFAYSSSLATLHPKITSFKDLKNTKNVFLETLNLENEISQGTDIESVFSDWSVPQKVNEILKDKSKNDKIGYNTEELSQIISIHSNSVIDWDQISEMIKSPTLK